MKLCLGLAGNALPNQYRWLSMCENDERWDFIARLDSGLHDWTSMAEFRSGLRSAIFSELTLCCQDCSRARICHFIHPR